MHRELTWMQVLSSFCPKFLAKVSELCPGLICGTRDQKYRNSYGQQVIWAGFKRKSPFKQEQWMHRGWRRRSLVVWILELLQGQLLSDGWHLYKQEVCVELGTVMLFQRKLSVLNRGEPALPLIWKLHSWKSCKFYSPAEWALSVTSKLVWAQCWLSFYLSIRSH